MILHRSSQRIIISCTYIIIGVIGWCFAIADAKDPDTETRVYDLPLKEVETMFSGWMTGNGFGVKRLEREMGKIKLVGERSDEKWIIQLKPRSALATGVAAEYRKNGISDTDTAANIWEWVASQSNAYPYEPGARVQVPASSNERKPVSENKRVKKHQKTSDEEIPPVILSRIESVVCIKALVGESEIQFSGFVVDQDGLILCTAHNLVDVKKITVVLYDGLPLDATLIKSDVEKDLALIMVKKHLESRIALEKGRSLLGLGERIYSVGCPINLRGTVFSGIINGPPRRVNNLTYWQVNMEIHPGSSGSPVFTERGVFSAVVKGRYKGTDTVGFLIPFETIVEFVREIKNL